MEEEEAGILDLDAVMSGVVSFVRVVLGHGRSVSDLTIRLQPRHLWHHSHNNIHSETVNLEKVSNHVLNDIAILSVPSFELLVFATAGEKLREFRGNCYGQSSSYIVGSAVPQHLVAWQVIQEY